MDQNLNRTDRQATLLRNRELFNKIILLSLILILTIANICIIFIKFLWESIK